MNSYPLRCKGYLPYALSVFGTTSQSVESPAPEYWISAGMWRDSTRNLIYGVAPVVQDGRTRIRFYKDAAGKEHADCVCPVDTTLAPGARWKAPEDEPDILVFGVHEVQK